MNKITNVFVIDDDAAVRDSLCMLLKAEGYTVATFSEADAFLAIFSAEIQGCIILDVNMYGMSGPELQKELNRRGSRLPIIFLTGQGSVPLSVRSIKSGAVDFLIKPINGEELLACIQQACETFSQLPKHTHDNQDIITRLEKLTNREKEVMMIVIEGLTSKEIAERLGISFRTVENYRANIMQKTGAKNIIELSRIATNLVPYR